MKRIWNTNNIHLLVKYCTKKSIYNSGTNHYGPSKDNLTVIIFLNISIQLKLNKGFSNAFNF